MSANVSQAFTVKPLMGWLILQGIKDVENRSRSVKPPQGTCAVSFSKGYSREEYEFHREYLEECIGWGPRKLKTLPKYEDLLPLCGKVVGVVDYEVAEASQSIWYDEEGFAWKVSNPRWLPQPFPVRGFLNMWPLAPADAEKIQSQLNQ